MDPVLAQNPPIGGGLQFVISQSLPAAWVEVLFQKPIMAEYDDCIPESYWLWKLPSDQLMKQILVTRAKP